MSKPTHVAVFDFDGTLLPKTQKSLFDIMDKTLSEGHRKEIEEIRQNFFKKFHSNQLTPEEDRLFYFQAAKVYIKAGLSVSKVKSVLAETKLRPFVPETIRFLHEQGVPIAIISYSYFQWIDFVCEQNGVSSFISKIYAANLVIKDGLICGYRPETFVFSENKGVFSRQFARQYGVPEENILAVGDSAADARLGYLKKNRLGLARDQAEKEKIQEFFGEVIITETFDPVLEWLEKKLAG